MKNIDLINMIKFQEVVIEKTISYLIMYELGSWVSTANGRPKPTKYGQLPSIKVNRLCNSQPILNHLYSKA